MWFQIMLRFRLQKQIMLRCYDLVCWKIGDTYVIILDKRNAFLLISFQVWIARFRSIKRIQIAHKWTASVPNNFSRTYIIVWHYQFLVWQLAILKWPQVLLVNYIDLVSEILYMGHLLYQSLRDMIMWIPSWHQLHAQLMPTSMTIDVHL